MTFNPDVQPELPAYLADLAAQIAINSPEVAQALGFKPGAGLAGMPGVKTALNESQCERSHHLCVGPTFLLPDQGRALWAIVDLTDGRLVGPAGPRPGRVMRNLSPSKACKMPW